MNNQYHPFAFYHKIVQRANLEKFKEEFISDMDDTIDTYDPETETKTILDRNSLVSSLDVKEIIIPFKVHIENIVQAQELELINYIKTKYFDRHILDPSNRFLNGIIDELKKISQTLKWNDYKEIESIIDSSLKNILLETTRYLKNEHENLISDNSIIFHMNLEVFHTVLLDHKLIADIDYPAFEDILKQKTANSKIEWLGTPGETYYLFKQLKALKLITPGRTFWAGLEIYFKPKKIKTFAELRSQHVPKSKQQVLDDILEVVKSK